MEKEELGLVKYDWMKQSLPKNGGPGESFPSASTWATGMSQKAYLGQR
jgi:hypothetical protein